MQLFLVYLGGSAPGAHIELHDVRFVVGETIAETYPQLRQQWFGSQTGLHMDSYLAIHHIDGYRVSLRKEPSKGDKRLFFVNYGGYFMGRIPEFHDFTLCVAKDAAEAKQIGRAQVAQRGLAGADELHKDDLLEVDDCLALDLLDGWYVHLEHDGGQQALHPDWAGYQPLP
ncbi:DUF1543 domain-containing protein [Pseudidiomarina taiwanensis]|uniref:DUF1543 domain-containing protein n=1 Tax=Pseudidiomarina taiwanensis TaxID=337250 RepID=A0A432ZFR3_9GAMM|nr:DUF1543 domain-containing protein [Pseudidiomarina taiwanensis]RUO76749.1 DUF1543 domain-containing protein [Pseudidiomarina taiwanensis]